MSAHVLDTLFYSNRGEEDKESRFVKMLGEYMLQIQR